MTQQIWEEIGTRQAPSWYLDPLVGQQKREANVKLIQRWSGDRHLSSVLKTDLFEEAFGNDRILPDLFPTARLVCGIDQSSIIARTAADRFPSIACGISVMNVAHCGIRDGVFDLVISTSTLDHFPTRAGFLTALAELARVLRPNGLLIITLDNPLNPLYHPLKWASQLKFSPFPLGYTPAPDTLRDDLAALSLVVEDEDWILHNPRGLSTALFLAIRKVMGGRADRWIAHLLSAFAVLGNLPTRRLTACFFCVAARKP